MDNVDRLYRRKVPSLLSADDLNAIRNHFGLDSRSFKGVEGSARNDGGSGNGDGGEGNGDAAEASAESPVKAAKGGGNQGATISPDGDKQRDKQQPDGSQRTRNAYPDFAIPQCCSRTMAPRLSHGTTWRRRCAGPCAGMRWGSGTSASVPAARVPQFTRAIASQCGAAWSRTGTSSTAAGRSSVRWHIRTSGGEGWRCNMVGMVGSSWAEVQQRGICAYIVPSISAAAPPLPMLNPAQSLAAAICHRPPMTDSCP